MDNKNKELGGKLFKKVKANLSSARKYNKEKGLNTASYGWGRKSQQVDIEVWDNTKWDKQGRKYIDSYTIKVDRDEDFAKVKTHNDVMEVFVELRNLLFEQKKVKGWGGLNYMSEQVSLESGSWNGYEVSIIPKVCLADAPCSEYKSLMNYINKYGKGEYGTCPNLKNYELFSAQMGGKRGRLWDEYGDRYFLDNKPKRCARILEELRKARGTNDRMICKRGNEDYIDPIDQKYSAYHEIECEGERRYFLEITIKTPSGKVKYTEKIY
jgi:hypothetical protein